MILKISTELKKNKKKQQKKQQQQQQQPSIEMISNGPGHAKMCLIPYANNKGADQPVHPRSLISTVVVRCLDRIMSLVSISEISIL